MEPSICCQKFCLHRSGGGHFVLSNSNSRHMGFSTIYEGHVRNMVEYPPLAWRGTMSATLKKLDTIHDKAGHWASLNHPKHSFPLSPAANHYCVRYLQDALQLLVWATSTAPPKPTTLLPSKAMAPEPTSWWKHTATPPFVAGSISWNSPSDDIMFPSPGGLQFKKSVYHCLRGIWDEQ